MRKGGIIAIFLALLLATASAYLVRQYLEGVSVKEVPEFATAPVVVATKDLTFGTALEASMLAVVRYPSESVPDGAYADPDSLVGEVTKVFLVRNEPIIAAKLSSKGGGLSLRIPETFRASSVKVNEVSGVSGFVLPGDRVDVLVTVGGRGNEEPMTQTVLQGIEVLAAGTKTEFEGNKSIDVQQITLLTTPKDGEKLALAQHQGKIHLALRNPIDQDSVETFAVQKADIIKTQKKPAPRPVYRAPAPKPEPTSRTVIRGGQAQTEEPVMSPESPGK